MKFRKTVLASVLIVLLTLLLPISAAAAEQDIVVLYTNDIHSYIDGDTGLTYSKVAALKSSLENAILVDAGDHIQGTAYGDMDEGATILRLMNAAEYDLATLGNHEFDYGMDSCMAAITAADFPYLSCNFHHEEDGVAGENVLDSYSIVEIAGKRIAFIGISTPETMTSTTPSCFQDGQGDYIYGFAGGSDGSDLYAAVQKAIDTVKADADYIIAVGHLGVDSSSRPWTSRDVIANTEGLDAFIDGHSHSAIESETVIDKAGQTVLLTQTGSYLNTVGKLTLSSDGSLSAELLSAEDLLTLAPDADVKAIEDAWIAEIEAQLGAVIGYSEITLDNFDDQGNRLVRKQSTNSGDFSADALYYLFDEMNMDVDLAVMNGGGIRNTALSGELTYLSCKKIHPFGNVACLLRVSGQQVLDMLEWSVRALTPDGSVEDGSFLHVAGIQYTVDLTIPSTVQADEKDVWIGAPTGAYRVKNVTLRNETGIYEPLDLAAEYNLAGYNYTLRNPDGGFGMLTGARNVLDYVAEDYMVLANYIQSFPISDTTGLPTIYPGDGYDSKTGSGRITIVSEPASSESTVPSTPTTGSSTYTVVSGDSLWKIAQKFYGTGTKWTAIYGANRTTLSNPSLLQIGQQLAIPAA